jgi:DNA helicase HerA-like ATPase
VKSAKAKRSYSSLVLGWRLTPNLDPVYWLNKTAKPGQQSESDLVTVPATLAATHTAIIAQSGSGKSFFLGRLIEELCLRTKARCVVLDPNSDFSKMYEAQDAKVWRDAGYDVLKRRGSLPHEPTKEAFLKQWSRVSIRVKTGAAASTERLEKLKLRWSSISADFLAEDLDPMLRGELYHAHSFVKNLEWLLVYRSQRPTPAPKSLKEATPSAKHQESEKIDLLAEAERLLQRGREEAEQDFRSELEKEFPQKEFSARNAATATTWLSLFNLRGGFLDILLTASVRSKIEGLVKGARYVSETVERYYFAKARGYQAAGIVESEPLLARTVPSCQLEIVDLPSFAERNTRLLVTNAVVSEESDRAKAAWNKALQEPSEKDNRVPTFIVVDEAHNLIPSEPRTPVDAALREQFRTIVAEGRKYGLFLILVSQRPDKLDPLVLSECENRAVMKLSSMSVLKVTRERLGLDDVSTRLLEKCLEFETGRMLLIGNWAQQAPLLAYCAARRTVEGGRNLQADSWAVAERAESAAKTKRKGRTARGPQPVAGKQSPPPPRTGTGP